MLADHHHILFGAVERPLEPCVKMAETGNSDGSSPPFAHENQRLGHQSMRNAWGDEVSFVRTADTGPISWYTNPSTLILHSFSANIADISILLCNFVIK